MLQISWCSHVPLSQQKREIKTTQVKRPLFPPVHWPILEGAAHSQDGKQCRLRPPGRRQAATRLNKEQLKEVPFHPTPRAPAKPAERPIRPCPPSTLLTNTVRACARGRGSESWPLPGQSAHCPKKTFSGPRPSPKIKMSSSLPFQWTLNYTLLKQLFINNRSFANC